MTRPIKFRIWDKKFKRWITGLNVMVYGNGDFAGDRTDTETGDEIETVQGGDEIELEQFTGLADKNGKEIYQGDIVRIIKPDTKLNSHRVEWRNTSFGLVNPKGEVRSMGRVLFKDKAELEVIGNIHENKELLK